MLWDRSSGGVNQQSSQPCNTHRSPTVMDLIPYAQALIQLPWSFVRDTLQFTLSRAQCTPRQTKGCFSVPCSHPLTYRRDALKPSPEPQMSHLSAVWTQKSVLLSAQLLNHHQIPCNSCRMWALLCNLIQPPVHAHTPFFLLFR